MMNDITTLECVRLSSLDDCVKTRAKMLELYFKDVREKFKGSNAKETYDILDLSMYLSTYQLDEHSSLSDRLELFRQFTDTLFMITDKHKNRFQLHTLSPKHIAYFIQQHLIVYRVPLVQNAYTHRLESVHKEDDDNLTAQLLTRVGDEYFNIEKLIHKFMQLAIGSLDRHIHRLTNQFTDLVFNCLKTYSPILEVESQSKNELVFQNCVYDLSTKSISTKKSGYYIYSSHLNVIANVDKKMYQFIDYLFESWSDHKPEIKQLLIQLPIYALEKNGRKKLVLFISPGGGGKTTYKSCIQSLFGKDAPAQTLSLNIDQLNVGDMISSIGIGKSLIYGDDLESNPKLLSNIGNLKSILSHETVFVNRKYSHAVPIYFSGLWIQNSNQMFTINDFSPAIRDRMMIVNWTSQNFRTSKKKLAYSLDECLDPSSPSHKVFIEHFLKYCLDHYIYQDAFYTSPELEQMLVERLESVNPIYQFIDKVLVAHGLFDYRTLSLNCLYVMYQSWAMSEGVKSSFKLAKFNELIFQEFEKRQLSFEKNQCQASTIQNQFPTAACEDLLSSSLSIQSQWKDVMQVKKHQVIKFTNIPKATANLNLADIKSHQDFAQVKRSFLKKINSGDASIISEIISFFHGSIDNTNGFFLLSYDDFLELTNSSKNDN